MPYRLNETAWVSLHKTMLNRLSIQIDVTD